MESKKMNGMNINKMLKYMAFLVQ